LARTVFVTAMLGLASFFFVRDANLLVLNPIERMLKKVKYIAKNPLAATKDNIDHAALGVIEELHKREGEAKKPDVNLETAILEEAITKIGHLLALGFGEAGAGIIA
jgi:hypothetical protein